MYGDHHREPIKSCKNFTTVQELFASMVSNANEFKKKKKHG